MHIMSESGILIVMNYFCIVLYIMYVCTVCRTTLTFKYQLLNVFSHNAQRVPLMYSIASSLFQNMLI